MSDEDVDSTWVFEIREDADGQEIERRGLFSSPSAIMANEWLDTFLSHLNARGPDEKGRM